jgi:hypothetical protein
VLKTYSRLRETKQEKDGSSRIATGLRNIYKGRRRAGKESKAVDYSFLLKIVTVSKLKGKS